MTVKTYRSREFSAYQDNRGIEKSSGISTDARELKLGADSDRPKNILESLLNAYRGQSQGANLKMRAFEIATSAFNDPGLRDELYKKWGTADKVKVIDSLAQLIYDVFFESKPEAPGVVVQPEMVMPKLNIDITVRQEPTEKAQKRHIRVSSTGKPFSAGKGASKIKFNWTETDVIPVRGLSNKEDKKEPLVHPAKKQSGNGPLPKNALQYKDVPLDRLPFDKWLEKIDSTPETGLREYFKQHGMEYIDTPGNYHEEKDQYESIQEFMEQGMGTEEFNKLKDAYNKIREKSIDDLDVEKVYSKKQARLFGAIAGGVKVPGVDISPSKARDELRDVKVSKLPETSHKKKSLPVLKGN